MADDIWGAAVDRRLAREGYANVLDERSAEEARRARAIGRSIGVPGSIVEADLPGFEKQAEAEKAKTLFDYAPGLAAYAAKPENAAVIKDDLPTAAEISRMFNQTREGELPIGTAEQNNDPLGKRFIQRMKGSTTQPWALQRPFLPPKAQYGATISAPTQKPRPVGTDAGDVARGLEAGIIGGISKAALGIEQAVADTLGFGDWYRSTDYYRSTRFKTSQDTDAADVDFSAGKTGQILGTDVNLPQWGYQAATSLGQLGAGIVTGQPLPFISLLSGGEFYERVRGRGATHKEALRGAILTGAIEAGTEKLPLEYMIGSMGKKATGKFLGGFLLREAPTEVLATIGQGAVDALTTGGKGWDAFVADLPQDIVDTLGTTAFMGGAMGGLNLAARRLSPEARAMDDIEQATAGAAFLDKLMTHAGESKARTSDPETFKEFVESQTAETPVRELYVPVEAINEYMQSEGYEAGALEAYSDQIAEAQATQGDVVIPVADAAAYLAGTPAWEALKDKVRLQPGGLSQKEALEQHAEIMAVLEQRGAEIAKEVDEQDAAASDAGEVYSDVKNRLIAGGVKPDVAEQTAQLVAARYEAQGKRRGTTAMEAWKKANVLLPGERAGKAKGRKLAQAEPLMIGDVAYEVNEDGSYKVELAAQKDKRTLGENMSIRDLRKQLGDELTARILAGEGGTEGRRVLPNVDLTMREGGLALRGRTEPLPVTINIGLNVNDGSSLTVQDAVAALSKAGVVIKTSRVAQSTTEPTFIAELDRALTSEEATRISKELRQDAIAQRVGEEGALFGPAAEKWGPFNPEFFLDLQMLFQSDVMTSLPSGADTDAVGNRILAYHGTPFEFDEFRPGKAIWFSEGRGLAERYADPRRFRKAGEGRVINAEIAIQAPLDLDPALHSLPDHTVVENPVQWVQERFGFDIQSHGWEKIGQTYAHDIFRSAAFADAAREAGYDTLKMTEGGNTTWGVLDPQAIAPQDRELFQAEAQPPFYSALTRALEQSKTTKASAEQWKATLRKTPGIKQEELEWSGLLEWLDGPIGQSGPVTREDLLTLVERGGIQVEEVLLGRPIEDKLADYGYDVADMNDPEHEANIIADDFEPQFKSWSSDPHNPTYRELLITLPVGVGGNPSNAPSTHWGTEAVVAHTRFMDKVDADGKRVLFVEEIQSDWHQKGRDQGYEQPASPEQKAKIDAAEEAFRQVTQEQEANRVARRNLEIELNKLAAPLIIEGYNKSVADMEEAARKNPEKIPPEVLASVKDTFRTTSGAGFFTVEGVDEDLRGYVGWNDLKGWIDNARRVLGGLPPEIETKVDEIEKLGVEYRERMREENLYEAELRNARSGLTASIPNAPFKSSWPALVMKRLIRYAAENGYDRVAWTPGEEQAERYNLSKAVGALVNEGMHDSEGHRIRMQLRAASVLADNGHGQIVEQYQDQGTLRMTEGQMREAFGNDIAQRLIESEGEPLRGNDLRVGGEGMKAFYDRNLVNITNDIIKKYGAKVEKTQIVEPGSAFDMERPGFDITDKMREAAMQGFTLFQRPSQPRGSTTFLSDGSRLIRLFETANESTLAHEFGHVWLEEIKADALGEDATDQEKADWESLKKWWAKQGITVTDEGEIPEIAHEFFARTFERYLREGRPPIRVLRGPFKAFAGWLTRIYQQVRSMNAPINPELRGIFDRMLATEDAIEAYRAQENVGPLFNSAEEAGMTSEEFAAYGRLVANARDTAYDTLLEKTMAAVRAKRRADMREQRSNIRAQVAAEINGQPMFVALHLLRTGRWLGDSQRERQDVKLNTGWLIDTFGEDILGQLPKGLPITRGDGLDGDTVAEMVGAASGQELVHALVGMRTASEALRASGETRSLREKMVEEEVDRRMAERHGDTLDDGSIEEEAIAALNTATQGEVIAAEARQLAKRATTRQPLTPYQFAREWARRKVMAGKVNDTVSRSALQRYTRATAKSARLAETAILEGNTDEAYRQKQAQLLNHALLAESKIAADEVDTIVARMKRLAGRAAMKSVDQDYMDKIHQLLEGYDFRDRSQRSIEEQEDFQEWAERQRAMGFEVHIPPRLENRGDPYSRVTVEELMSLNDLVQSLLHLGRLKNKLKVAQQERDFNEFVDEVVTRIEQLPQRKLPEKPINEEQRAGAGLAAELVKIETLVEELDGGATGPLNDVIVRGATEAENKRVALRHQVLVPIVAAYHGMGRKMKKRLHEKVTIPELTWNTLNEGDPRQGQPVTITRSELLSIALNMGNLSNLEKLSKGERWPVPTLQAVMDRELTKEDWDLVQLLWRQVDSLWPQIVAVEREQSGVVPEKVVPVPIETRFGTYEGGYWPVVYDAGRWQRAEDLEAAKLDDMFGIKSGVATQKGHTITRTQAFGPINLSLENVLFQHLEQVVTRIAYTSFARDVLRVIRNPRIRGIIDTRLGSEYRKQVEPWLGRIIHEGAVHAKAARWWQKVLKQARINITVAAMGFRFSTGIAQTLGLTASAHRIGAANVANGLRMVALRPRQSAEFAFSRSQELSNRNGAANREISEVFGQLRGKHSMLAEAQAWAFWHIGMIDRYMVALPTWLGAHQRGIREGMTDDEASAYADKAVRQSQGSGAEKDLAAFQSPNNDAMRFFTMFYTPFNVLFNEQWKGVRGLKKGQIAPIAGVTFWWMMAMTLADALMSGDAPDWDDEEAVLGWFGRNVFFSLFAGVPIIRDAATYVERKQIGEYAEFNSNPITRIWDAVEKTYKAGDKLATEGETPKRPIKQTADVTAILTGVPISQAGTSGQFLWDYHEGEADPQDISDWYFGITRGKVPEPSTE